MGNANNTEAGRGHPGRLVALGLLIAAISVLHFVTPVSRPVYHDVFVRVYYLPITLAGLWFGLRGGLGSAILISLVYTPHLILQVHGPFPESLGYFLEIPVFIGVGALTGTIVETEKRHRDRLQETADRLERSHRALREQTKLLLEKEEQLRRADRLSALGQLSAGLAHEIRNPLGAIKGAVEIIQDDYGHDHPKYEFLQIILREVQRLNGVVTNFLDFARPARPQFREVDVSGILHSLEGLVAGQARRNRVEIETDLAAESHRVRADEGLLEQALLNIVLNALEAMPRGGRLHIATRLKGMEDGRRGALEITIDDTGSGIAPEDRARVFDPFFTTKKEGTGLGLPIAHRIIESHRGTIDLVSEPGEGTTFIVILPLDAAQK